MILLCQITTQVIWGYLHRLPQESPVQEVSTDETSKDIFSFTYPFSFFYLLFTFVRWYDSLH